ncbi:MAG: lauroyl acyltransferase [Rhodobacteraceae bacterium]|nr:lauroyl acyltransferase [Paracoccaceae bacterium]
MARYRRNRTIDTLNDAALRGLIGAARLLPYRWRVPFFGWASARIIAPIAGWRSRIRNNLALVAPDMDPKQARRILRGAPDNAGRSMIEMYSGDEFLKRARALPLEGAGVEALEAARDAGRPIIVATAHFGNYNAARAALLAKGFDIGSLYRAPSNPKFAPHYTRMLAAVGGTLFSRDRKGMAQMVRHLKSGKPLLILFDLHVTRGAVLSFLGKPAMTSLAAADMALRHDALLVPFYGIRCDNGLDFRVVIDAPIEHTTPEEMMQALNNSLERHLEDHAAQWSFMHRRWKMARRNV